jgi:uncharacterized protein
MPLCHSRNLPLPPAYPVRRQLHLALAQAMLPRRLIPKRRVQLHHSLLKSLFSRNRPSWTNYRNPALNPRLERNCSAARGMGCSWKRGFHIQSIFLPPLIFVGLLVGLYTWKSFMLVLFQNKIIYNPGLPPSARFEKIEDYEKLCGGLRWSQAETRAEDGTRLALAHTTIQLSRGDRASRADQGQRNPAHIYVLYLQGR